MFEEKSEKGNLKNRDVFITANSIIKSIISIPPTDRLHLTILN